mgnify:CR=1 FL=1
MTYVREYKFFNYQNEVIHTEITNNPEQVENKLINQGHKVGGFSLIRTIK